MLPDRLLITRQKLVRNDKIGKLKCEFWGNFKFQNETFLLDLQPLCISQKKNCLKTIIIWVQSTCTYFHTVSKEAGLLCFSVVIVS